MSNVGYLIIQTDESTGKLMFLEHKCDIFSEYIHNRTWMFSSPNMAFEILEEMKRHYKDLSFNLEVRQFVTDPEDSTKFVLWKISDHAFTHFSYVVTGIKEGKRVYYTDDGDTLTESLSCAENFNRCKDAVNICNRLVSASSEKDKAWLDVERIRIQHAYKDTIAIDLEQEPVVIKAFLPRE